MKDGRENTREEETWWSHIVLKSVSHRSLLTHKMFWAFLTHKIFGAFPVDDRDAQVGDCCLR